ncbi:MAG: YibE/F family protein, partial [Clostridiales bacterium]|nr:YibE/F family protein [Clostridiales bacterium]
LLAALAAIFIATGARAYSGFISVADPNLSYYRATVTETDNSQLALPDYGGARAFGLQVLSLRIAQGPHEGETVYVRNSVMPDSYIRPEVGDNVIVSVDVREGGVIYALLTSYYRMPGLVFIGALFVLLLVGACGRKGVRALFGLAFTMIAIIFFTIPRIYSGGSPIFYAVLTAIITSVATLLLLNGYHKKTFVAATATIAGFCAAGLIFGAFSLIGQVSGYNTQSLGMLTYFSAETGLQIKDLLFAGVLISSLGAVMDVSMSVASAVYEVYAGGGEHTVRSLFRAGMEVSKDTIGTMSNTLILAFTGGALSGLIALTGYGIQPNRFFNSDFIAIEIGSGLSASAALILTAPAASIAAAVAYLKKHARRQPVAAGRAAKQPQN